MWAPYRTVTITSSEPYTAPSYTWSVIVSSPVVAGAVKVVRAARASAREMLHAPGG